MDAARAFGRDCVGPLGRRPLARRRRRQTSRQVDRAQVAEARPAGKAVLTSTDVIAILAFERFRPSDGPLACRSSAKTGEGRLTALRVTRTPDRKPPSAADGIALHAAGVGGGFEDPALGGFLAGAAGEAAFRPCVADP